MSVRVSVTLRLGEPLSPEDAPLQDASRVWEEQVQEMVKAFGTECTPVRASGMSLAKLVLRGLNLGHR